MAKGRNGGSDTLSGESIGFGSGFKDGDGGDRSGFLNQASADMGNPFAQQQQGGFLGGFFNPGRMAGAGIGSLVAGPIGGLLGGLIGGGGLRGWGYEDPQGNRVSAFRDMFDGGGKAACCPTLQTRWAFAPQATARVRRPVLVSPRQVRRAVRGLAFIPRRLHRCLRFRNLSLLA